MDTKNRPSSRTGGGIIINNKTQNMENKKMKVTFSNRIS